LLALAAAAAASVRHVRAVGGEDAAAQMQAACADRASAGCVAAVAAAADLAGAELQKLAQRSEVDVRPLAVKAAGSAAAPLRAAAAAALGVPFATAAETPLLAELADDPVPAVRAAALHALRSSNDPRGQLLARRAEAFGSVPAAEREGESAEAPVTAAAVGVPLPADTVYLHFASQPSAGRYGYWTAQAPAAVLAALRGKGKGPWTTAEFRAQAQPPSFAEGGMPSADQMAQAMAMAEQMMKAMESAAGDTPEEQAAAMQRAAGGMAAFDAGLADSYEDAELFAEPRLLVVPVAGSADAVVAVYRDLAVGGTGVTVHRTALPRP
jgi:hypothetical protein